MGHWARGEVWIPLHEWYAFVRGHMPISESGLDAIGPPRIDGDDLVVPYAINTECPPREEADPPEWTKGGA